MNTNRIPTEAPHDLRYQRNAHPHRQGRQAHARAGHEGPRRFNVTGWLLWTVGFVSFPIAGIAAQAAVGRINDAVSALVGGLVAGAVIGDRKSTRLNSSHI